MRGFMILFLLFFMTACNLNATVESPKVDKAKKDHSEAQLLKKMKTWTDQQLAKDKFSFTLEVGAEQKNIYKGQQTGEDWSLEGENQIRIIKKGDKIHLSSKGKKETLTADQFGLLSPRDHLLLIGGEGNIEKITMNQKEALQIELSNQAVSEKLQQRLGDHFANSHIAERVAEQNRILYELEYWPQNKQLRQMKVRIILQDENSEEEILYHFLGKEEAKDDLSFR